MRSASFAVSFIVAMILLCPFAAGPAHGEEAPSAPPLLGNNVCDITGTVSKLQAVERSPWADGTPSALNSYETDIWVTVNERKPHYKNASSDSVCNKGARGETRTYKLCSGTTLKPGDRIQATEGLQTGTPASSSCLFDVVLLPGAGKKT